MWNLCHHDQAGSEMLPQLCGPGPHGNRTQILSSACGAPSREPFVPDEIFSTIFQQQTLQLPPDSFLIEMQINLCG